jgi:hypothetical protein
MLFPHQTTTCGGRKSLDRYPLGSWLARKDSNLRSPDPEDSRRFCCCWVRSERGADSDSVDPASNQVEHAGRSQVNVRRSSNSGSTVSRIDGWER